MDLKFEWDEKKRAFNLAKHGIDFIRAKEIWQYERVEIASDQTWHGEERFIGIGQAVGRIITVIYTKRKNTIRIISARAARDYEKANYENHIG